MKTRMRVPFYMKMPYGIFILYACVLRNHVVFLLSGVGETDTSDALFVGGCSPPKDAAATVR
jgi:hypothetical protein